MLRRTCPICKMEDMVVANCDVCKLPMCKDCFEIHQENCDWSEDNPRPKFTEC